MIEEDYEQYKICFPGWAVQCGGWLSAELGKAYTICLLSPNNEQKKLFKELFPEAHLTIKTKKDWDLNNKSTDKYNVIVAMNVFHYSYAPTLWFKNVFNSCSYFWLQDLIKRDRGPRQLGADKDAIRYQLSPKIISNYMGAFDLNRYKKRMLHFKTYKDPKNSIHFICNMKGDIE